MHSGSAQNPIPLHRKTLTRSESEANALPAHFARAANSPRESAECRKIKDSQVSRSVRQRSHIERIATVVRPIRAECTGSQRILVTFPGTDPDDRFHRGHPHLAVTDLPGASRSDDRPGDPIHEFLIDQYLDPDLRYEIDRVFGSA